LTCGRLGIPSEATTQSTIDGPSTLDASAIADLMSPGFFDLNPWPPQARERREKPVVPRYRGKLSRLYCRADGGSAIRRSTNTLKAKETNTPFRLPASPLIWGISIEYTRRVVVRKIGIRSQFSMKSIWMPRLAASNV
jgi:hypothetical protein